MSVTPLPPGFKMGRYRILRMIGSGATAYVYAAERIDEPGLAHVALKILHSRHADVEGAQERFDRETMITAKLSSPFIVSALHAGRFSKGSYRDLMWIAFPLLSGETLRERLEAQSRLDWNALYRIVADVLAGLVAAHEARVVHRDIKPGNIFLEHTAKGDVARILDFGISKVPSDSASYGSPGALTEAGDLLGTPGYMAPEQLDRPESVDGRADLFSVGVVAFRSLTGRYPFRGDNDAQRAISRRLGVRQSLREATGLTWPEGLESWLMQVLNPNREERFASARGAQAAWSTLADLSLAPCPTRDEVNAAYHRLGRQGGAGMSPRGATSNADSSTTMPGANR